MGISVSELTEHIAQAGDSVPLAQTILRLGPQAQDLFARFGGELAIDQPVYDEQALVLSGTVSSPHLGEEPHQAWVTFATDSSREAVSGLRIVISLGATWEITSDFLNLDLTPFAEGGFSQTGLMLAADSTAAQQCTVSGVLFLPPLSPGGTVGATAHVPPALWVTTVDDTYTLNGTFQDFKLQGTLSEGLDCVKNLPLLKQSEISLELPEEITTLPVPDVTVTHLSGTFDAATLEPAGLALGIEIAPQWEAIPQVLELTAVAADFRLRFGRTQASVSARGRLWQKAEFEAAITAPELDFWGTVRSDPDGVSDQVLPQMGGLLEQGQTPSLAVLYCTGNLRDRSVTACASFRPGTGLSIGPGATLTQASAALVFPARGAASASVDAEMQIATMPLTLSAWVATAREWSISGELDIPVDDAVDAPGTAHQMRLRGAITRTVTDGLEFSASWHAPSPELGISLAQLADAIGVPDGALPQLPCLLTDAATTYQSTSQTLGLALTASAIDLAVVLTGSAAPDSPSAVTAPEVVPPFLSQAGNP
ncbi:hypothetical protein [Streptomyces sp. x-80]|uniref:hypothetical protein n=1 Tax=Streptomyces sp. x-80 TaxID=2789282 RepID=UPI00398165A7